jgi:GNAT superfamily N-acetyltransferase
MPFAVDPALMEAWLRARSLSRGLPPPVPDSGGLRVDSALPHETQRYLFARPVEGLRALAERIREPRIPVKLCDAPEVMRTYLPSRWKIAPPNYVMTCREAFDQRNTPRRLVEGYRLEVTTNADVTCALIRSASGEVAANGHAARWHDVFIYDRISTAENLRRKGLGAAIMTALASQRPVSARLQILVATPEGRELYRSLGWTDYAPYTSAAIPEAN